MPFAPPKHRYLLPRQYKSINYPQSRPSSWYTITAGYCAPEDPCSNKIGSNGNQMRKILNEPNFRRYGTQNTTFPRRKANPIALAALALLTAAPTLRAQGVDYIKSHYTKYEHYIPMRDGVRLFTAVYVPKDSAKPWPMLMMRTPYSVRPYGPDKYPANLGPSEVAAKAEYIFVNQDVRGRFMSEGTFEQVRPHNTKLSESTDTFDTIEWLLKHVPDHNGKV